MTKEDYVDITLMAKRGLIKMPNQGNENLKMNKEGYLELVSPAETISNNDSSGSATAQNAASPLSFFDNFSSNANTTANASPLASFDSVNTSQTASYFSNDSNSGASNSLDVNQLKLKIEDLEYKLLRLTETLDLITNKLANFENKTK